MDKVTPVLLDLLKKIFTTSNILKFIAILLGGAGAVGAMSTGPKMASASGAPMNDVLNMLIPALGGIVTWFAANWFKVKPDLIQAVTAVIANPKDPLADLRLASAVLVYIKGQWPEAPEALQLLSDGVKKLTDAVGVDLTKPTPPQ